jgi:hypothetical protein
MPYNSSINALNHLPGPLSGKRYEDHGAQQIIDDAAKAVETLRSLPAGQKETFASGFHELTAKLQARTSEQLARCQAMPAELPDPLPQPNVLYKANRRRGYTGREATEEDEKNARRAQKRAEHNAEDRRRENEGISQELQQEYIARHKQEEARRRESMAEYAAKFMERQQQQSLVAPGDLATLSSDELLDPPIT